MGSSHADLRNTWWNESSNYIWTLLLLAIFQALKMAHISVSWRQHVWAVAGDKEAHHSHTAAGCAQFLRRVTSSALRNIRHVETQMKSLYVVKWSYCNMDHPYVFIASCLVLTFSPFPLFGCRRGGECVQVFGFQGDGVQPRGEAVVHHHTGLQQRLAAVLLTCRYTGNAPVQ